MKKTVLFLALVCVGKISLAQDASTENFKPSAGDKNLEVQFTPFGSSVININGIRGRMFKTANVAYRFNAFLAYVSNTDITQQANPDFNDKELKDKDNVFTINLRPGYEKHFLGTNRLSPYIGAELDLALQKTVSKSEFESNNEVEVNKIIDANGYARFGVNAIAGFDFLYC